MAEPTTGLTAEQLLSFERDGYLIIRNALLPETVDGLVKETHDLLSSFTLEDHPLTRFSTGTKSEHVGDDYFLNSGDKVRFFFEEEAFDESTGKLNKPKELAVNKIGHNLHGLSEPFRALINDKELRDKGEISPAAVAQSLGYKSPRCLQSMIICKQPEIGGAVPPHQDSTFLYTNPPSAVGFWYALEDATLENGCLSFLPGSHRWAPISKRLVRKAFDTGTEIVEHDGPRFPPGEAFGEHVGGKPEDMSSAPYKSGEVKAGDLVLIHGNILHKSEPNRSRKSRLAYTFHIIEGEGPKYDQRNWLQPNKEGFTELYV